MTTSAMTTTPGPAPTWSHALRLFLLGTTVVVLLAIAFTVGHLTASSRQTPPTSAPTQVQAPANGVADISSYCQVGHVQGPC
jgi:hypothetical protein